MTALRKTAEGYVTPSGWEIRKDDSGRWVIFNPETGRPFDSSPTLRYLRESYGFTPTGGETPVV